VAGGQEPAVRERRRQVVGIARMGDRIAIQGQINY